MRARAGWIGVAIGFAMLALVGVALRASFALWPLLHLSRAETTLHGALALASGVGALLPRAPSRDTARASAAALLLAAGLVALSPSLLGFGPAAGFFAEPAQAICYALSGGWLAWKTRS